MATRITVRDSIIETAPAALLLFLNLCTARYAWQRLPSARPRVRLFGGINSRQSLRPLKDEPMTPVRGRRPLVQVVAALFVVACAGNSTSATAPVAPASTFTPNDVRVGALDNTGYFALEVSPDMKYLLWQESAGGIPGPVWTCAIDPDTAELTPAISGTGEMVLVRPTGATTGTISQLGVAANTTRKYPYPSRIAARAQPYAELVRPMPTCLRDNGEPYLLHIVLSRVLRLTSPPIHRTV